MQLDVLNFVRGPSELYHVLNWSKFQFNTCQQVNFFMNRASVNTGLVLFSTARV